MAENEPQVEPLTPQQYEAYVAELVRKLDFAKTGTVTQNRRFKGVRQPGYYEIDVALEVRLADAINFLLIVECKNWKRPVDRPVVQKLAQTRDAISADKAAIASPVGFTEEAESVARSLEIALWIITLEEWITSYPEGDPKFAPWAVHIAPPRTQLTSILPHRTYIHRIRRVEILPFEVGWARFFVYTGYGNACDDVTQAIAAKLMKDSAQEASNWG